MALVEKWVCCMPERIPSDVYELVTMRRDRRGLTMVFEGLRKIITVEFGFLPLSVRSGRFSPPTSGRKEEPAGQERENRLLYQVENSADLRRFQAEAAAAGHKEPLLYLVFLTSNDSVEVIAWGMPAVTVRPRQPEAAVQETLSTPLGPVEILADGRPLPYRCTPLPLQSQRFRVDGRWRLDCLLPGTTAPVEVQCRIAVDPAQSVTCGAETGEALDLMSFTWNNNKLSIGTEGDLPGMTCHYEKTGMRLRFLSGPGAVSLYLAWLTMTEPEREEIYPWFAADPSFDETRRRN